MPSITRSRTQHARHPRRTHTSTTQQLTELSWAVPQVITHRLARLAWASAAPRTADSLEFSTMVTEKQQAFVESWWAMGAEVWRQQQRLALAWCGGLSPLAAANPLAARQRVIAQLVDGPMRVAQQGLKPVHQKAVANARRLGRVRQGR